MARLQHSGEVRLPGRLHDAEDAEGQAGGLRGPDAPRSRRLALTSLRSLVAAALVLAGWTPAAAHSLLLASSPAANAVLTASPPYVALRFNNRIEKRLSRVRLVDERGTVAAAPTGRADDEVAESLLAVVPPLAPGVWRVEWQVFSTDGHVVTGSYQFRLAP
ncbi:MAG: copper resistance protein CopC [Candidatus Rokuibacteriota bacterium]|nr:MAG: copper resistance protein CopC [Candidatus Rokubacteria bacterium]PYN20752.1 MAG: copper resistance protein CopC [Candidatus Rokubacteria bacterium]